MYFQPSLTASTPIRSTDPLAISVKKGEIILQHLRGSVCLRGRSFKNYFKFFFFFFFFNVIFVYVLDNC